jgi:hypothetical protein
MSDPINTSPKAAERFSPYGLADGGLCMPVMETRENGAWVRHSEYAALSAKFTAAETERDALASKLIAADQRVEMLADSIAKAHAAGRAKGLREALHYLTIAGIAGDHHTDPLRQEILALITTETPAAKVTLTAQEAVYVAEGRHPNRQEARAAATLLSQCNGMDLDQWTGGDWPSTESTDALRAIAGGKP